MERLAPPRRAPQALHAQHPADRQREHGAAGHAAGQPANQAVARAPRRPRDRRRGASGECGRRAARARRLPPGAAGPARSHRHRDGAGRVRSVPVRGHVRRLGVADGVAGRGGRHARRAAGRRRAGVREVRLS